MKQKRNVSKIIATIVVWAFVLLCIMPFIWMVSASLKREADVFAIPFQLIRCV